MSGDYGHDDRGGGYRGGGGGGRGYGGGGGGRGRGGGHGGHERRGIPLSALDATTTEASRKAIGAAIEVHKTLGPGYDQSTYINALRVELDALNVTYTLKHPVAVVYKDKKIGESITDMYIDGKFFLDVLARPGQITTFERLALRAKLKAQDLELGLIINFAERRLKDGLVRVVNIDKITKEKGISLEEGDDHDDEFDDRG
ncbi:MAG: GxxExxY protein [Phycisphaerales bacterium]